MCLWSIQANHASYRAHYWKVSRCQAQSRRAGRHVWVEPLSNHRSESHRTGRTAPLLSEFFFSHNPHNPRKKGWFCNWMIDSLIIVFFTLIYCHNSNPLLNALSWWKRPKLTEEDHGHSGQRKILTFSTKFSLKSLNSLNSQSFFLEF